MAVSGMIYIGHAAFFMQKYKEEIGMKEKEIRVLKISLGEHPQEHTLENTLEAMQAAVGGYIEIVGLEEDICILLNEEGKLEGLPPNRRLGNDILVGDFYVCGNSEEGDLTSLPEDAMERYTEMFYEPLEQSLKGVMLKKDIGIIIMDW